MIYDLIVIGNGLAAQTFLFELFTNEKKSQNFSVAQVFSEEISPACSLRSSASVSRNGIETGISDLGDALSKCFDLFENFNDKYHPAGVIPVKQFVFGTNAKQLGKLIRRYKKIAPLENPLINGVVEGVSLQSYLVGPEIYHEWFESFLDKQKISRIKNFVKSVEKNESGHFECTLMNSEKIKAKKIVFATGAYARIHSHFFPQTQELSETTVVAGTYMEKENFQFPENFYFTVDGHSVLYRKDEKKLIIGSVSTIGPFLSTDNDQLKKILIHVSEFLKIDFGSFDDFSIITGLRHKGKKRRPVYKRSDVDHDAFLITGLYKNGFTLGHLTGKTIAEAILTP